MEEKIKYTTIKQIDIFDWDDLVKKVYNKPYNLQQQNGCYDDGENIEIDIDLKNPCEDLYEEITNIPLKVDGKEKGVSFNTWLETDPKTLGLSEWEYGYEKGLFWDRNFYPDVNYLAQDLCRRGYIEEGSYTIKIWW